jgi:hypothetical protein
VGLEKPKQNVLRKSRIGIALLAAALLAAAAVYTVPRAADAVSGLDDPARIAGRALDGTFDAVIAQREIEAALAAQDSELAQSVIDLAGVRHVAIDPALAEKVAAATAEAATMRYRAKSFARGLVTGEPQDMASWPARRSATCSYLAISVTLCAKVRGMSAAGKWTSWFWVLRQPASQLPLAHM